MEYEGSFEDRFWGFEFDWFALDQEGRLGLFASGGCGDVPKVVQRHFRAYDEITKSFSLPNYGSEAIWTDFTKYGFYVYDWYSYEGPYYKLVCKPSIFQITFNEVRDRILQIAGLPEFKLSFEESELIEVSAECTRHDET